MVPAVVLVVVCVLGQVYSDEVSHKNQLADSEMNFIQDISLRKWKAPELFEKEFLYYLSGHDDEGRPIWIAEFGKWDMKKIFDGGQDMMKTFDLYINQLVLRILESVKLADNEGDDGSSGEIVVIIDMEGYNLAQLTSVPSISYSLKKISQLEPIANRRLSAAYIINANFVAERFVNLIRPALGGVMQRVEIYGTQKSQWLPKLLKKLPRGQLPEWYGGESNFKPKKVFG